MDVNNTLGMSAVYLKLRPQKIAKVEKQSQAPRLSKTESMATCLGRRPGGILRRLFPAEPPTQAN
jgi:hypothetical protein